MSEILFQGKKVYYETVGEGRPVILLHGFAETHHLWDRLVPALGEEFRLILPDIPGSGQSELLNGNPSMEDYAKVLYEIATREAITGTRAITILGHSMGGYIALALAALYPGLLNGLGLVHSTVYPDEEEKKNVRKRGIEFLSKNGPEPFLRTSIPNLFAENTAQVRPWLIEEAIEISKNIPAEALIQYYQAMMERPDRTQVLRAMERPVMFLIGKFDKAVPLGLSLKQCHIPEVSYIRVLEHSGHMGIWEEERVASEFILQFLREL